MSALSVPENARGLRWPSRDAVLASAMALVFAAAAGALLFWPELPAVDQAARFTARDRLDLEAEWPRGRFVGERYFQACIEGEWVRFYPDGRRWAAHQWCWK
jgi:hypothetical protein